MEEKRPTPVGTAGAQALDARGRTCPVYRNTSRSLTTSVRPTGSPITSARPTGFHRYVPSAIPLLISHGRVIHFSAAAALHGHPRRFAFVCFVFRTYEGYSASERMM